MHTVRPNPSIAEAFEAFHRSCPAFETTGVLDELRAREFARIDAAGQVYLDYTGGGLFAESQVRRHMGFLIQSVFGNPHSANPTSRAASELIEHCRRRVLRFFNASPDEYAMIFTANASHALKIVGESYPFEAGDTFLLTFDNHNSVNGIREYDRVHGARTVYIPVFPPEMRVDEATLDGYLGLAEGSKHNLFAFPAQSNFSGVQHPLEWIARAKQRGWDVLLDAAAFVPTNRLDLSRWHPDYVALSFYKMFGYPTGVGALVARRASLEKLHRPWFAGGTITVASVQADRYFLAPGPEAFEDGTLDYLNIPAVDIDLEFLESIGIDLIHRRVACLAGWLIDSLLSLRHAGGEPLIALYGPPSTDRRGGTITMNFHDGRGAVIDHQLIEERAAARGISLRTGCFCNPGAGELALGLTKDEMLGCLTRPGSRMAYEDFRRCIDGKSSGAVRVSLGLVSNFPDVLAMVEFAREFLE